MQVWSGANNYAAYLDKFVSVVSWFVRKHIGCRGPGERGFSAVLSSSPSFWQRGNNADINLSE